MKLFVPPWALPFEKIPIGVYLEESKIVEVEIENGLEIIEVINADFIQLTENKVRFTNLQCRRSETL